MVLIAVHPFGDAPGAAFPAVLPSGKTLRGNFAIRGRRSGGAGGIGTDSISFGHTLASAPTAHFVPPTGANPHCPGSLGSPAAAPGQLCVYENTTGTQNVTSKQVCDPVAWACNASNKWGAMVEAGTGEDGSFALSGTWAVTAP